MTTFTTEDRDLAEKMGTEIGQALEKLVDNYVMHTGEPVPFFGWIDKEDTEMMLRQQLQVMQAEIQRLRKKLLDNGIKD